MRSQTVPTSLPAGFGSFMKSLSILLLLLQLAAPLAYAQRGGWAGRGGRPLPSAETSSASGTPSETSATAQESQMSSAATSDPERIVSGAQAATSGQTISKPYLSKYSFAWGDMLNVSTVRA